MDFSKYLLVSDLDGTLLKDDHSISERNLSAIKEWTDCGGKFIFATGRSVESAKVYADTLNLKTPVILFNGGVLYDFDKQQPLWENHLAPHYTEIVSKVRQDFPEIGIEIISLNTIYILKENHIVYEHVNYENLKYKYISDLNTPQPAIKVLLGVEPEKMDEFADYMFQNQRPDFNYVQTGPYYFELLPYGINKGDALKQYKKIKSYNDYFTIAIGDYNNDIQMIEYADLGVSVENALDLVKKSADLIVSDNNQDPIADIVEYIKSKEEK